MTVQFASMAMLPRCALPGKRMHLSEGKKGRDGGNDQETGEADNRSISVNSTHTHTMDLNELVQKLARLLACLLATTI